MSMRIHHAPEHGGRASTPPRARAAATRVSATGRRHALAAATAAVLLAAFAPAGGQAQGADMSAKVVVGGVVPDEATRAAIVARVREVYGADRVVDQLGVDRLVAPPRWTEQVQKVIDPDLKQVTHGQLSIRGNVVEVEGQVQNDAARAHVVSQIGTRLDNPTYTVRDKLRIGQPDPKALDEIVARRTIAFEAGNATLTPAGAQVLDDLVPVLAQFTGRRFEIVGHTDDSGSRDANLQLSAARAEAVKAYLVRKGVPPDDLVTAGAGPDHPVAPNTTAEGRARNRRIEFRVLA
jgi:OOP family OmpA-OmpF porin